jgi:ABC-type multidrug transport system fused ATPase/permease subunit
VRQEYRRLGQLTVRCETAPGEQGRRCTLFGCVMVLGCSRVLFAHFTTTPRLKTCLRGHLPEAEVNARDEPPLCRIRWAHVTFTRPLEDLNCSFQPSIDQKKLTELAKLRGIEPGENVIFLGLSGVGKTHLALARGIKAAGAG